MSNDGILLFFDLLEYHQLSESGWDGIVRGLKKGEDRTMKSLRFCGSLQSVSNSVS
jgi:hypothetical protein